MGFGDFESTGGIIILTKDPGEPALYWHQDWASWEDPISVTPWPQQIFVSYYLSDTSVENGCLKVIPGTHRKRILLHDELVPAHEQGARYIEEDHPVMFGDHPDQVDVCVRARSFVLADARLLHSARRNLTDERRTLILAWHRRRDDVWDKPPAYWRAKFPKSLPTATPAGSTPVRASPVNISNSAASRLLKYEGITPTGPGACESRNKQVTLLSFSCAVAVRGRDFKRALFCAQVMHAPIGALPWPGRFSDVHKCRHRLRFPKTLLPTFVNATRSVAWLFYKKVSRPRKNWILSWSLTRVRR